MESKLQDTNNQACTQGLWRRIQDHRGQTHWVQTRDPTTGLLHDCTRVEDEERGWLPAQEDRHSARLARYIALDQGIGRNTSQIGYQRETVGVQEVRHEHRILTRWAVVLRLRLEWLLVRQEIMTAIRLLFVYCAYLILTCSRHLNTSGYK